MHAPTPEAALSTARVIAVLGAHYEPRRAAFYVPQYLAAQGYRVLPINPRLVGRRLFGQPVRATLAEIDETVDIVDVFRRASGLADHVEDILAMTPAPGLVWLQLGISSDPFAERMNIAGIPVIQNRCTLADHQALGLGRAPVR